MAENVNILIVAPKTFEELFQIYSNYKTDPLDVSNDVYDGILLTQIDIWLQKSKLLKTVFSLSDTGMAWMQFKKWRLDFDKFEQLLKDICTAKNMDVDEIKQKMTEAGPPNVAIGKPIVVK